MPTVLWFYEKKSQLILAEAYDIEAKYENIKRKDRRHYNVKTEYSRRLQRKNLKASHKCTHNFNYIFKHLVEINKKLWFYNVILYIKYSQKSKVPNLPNAAIL